MKRYVVTEDIDGSGRCSVYEDEDGKFVMVSELRELLEKKISEQEKDSLIRHHPHHDFSITLYKELLAELDEEKVTK